MGLTKIDCDDNESDNYACKSKCEDISHVVFSDAASCPNGVLGWWLRRRSLLSAQAFFPGFLPTIILAYGFIFGWPRRTAGIAHRYSVSPFTVGLSLDFWVSVSRHKFGLIGKFEPTPFAVEPILFSGGVPSLSR